jgi:hypothetical protein
MPVLHVKPDDLTRLRFAYRPILEIPFSYQVLMNPEYQSPHIRWVEDTRHALYHAELPYLAALIPVRGYIPDFLTPTPLTNGGDIEDDLQALLATPDDLIHRNVRELIKYDGESEMRRFYLAHTREALQHLIEDLRLYWRRALQPTWSQMVTILEGDILYRGRLLALNGPESLLPDLHPSISYHDGEVHLVSNYEYKHCVQTVELAGDGIQLVPTIFTPSGRRLQLPPDWHPRIAYGARGVGLYNRETHTSKPLELALGTGRAQLLQGLCIPATTSEMAHRLSLTSGAVSQQLDRLKRAGLVESHRSGKRVYYQLTQRGKELIALFERIY